MKQNTLEKVLRHIPISWEKKPRYIFPCIEYVNKASVNHVSHTFSMIWSKHWELYELRIFSRQVLSVYI